MNNFLVEENVSLKNLNTYGIGGSARYLIKPRNVEELQNLIKYLEEEKIKWFLLGGGSNVILPDEDFDGAIIKLDNLKEITISDDKVFAYSGISLNELIQKLLDLDYVNLAPLFGIPGSLGGALVGNAGAYGKEIYDDVVNILVYKDGKTSLIKKENIKYSYRNTEFKNSSTIVLGATIKLEKGNKLEAKEKIKENMLLRKEKQPLEYKNAGSVFKNPEGTKAGKLIDECGLKDYSINDASVSSKHANFIINKKNATSHDIITLVNKIKEEVKKKHNIDLELEQVIVKW